MSGTAVTRRARAMLGAIVVGLVGLAACTGVPTDAKPQAISRDSLPEQLLPGSTSTTNLSADAEPVLIYLVRGEPNSEEQLTPVSVNVPSGAPQDRPEQVLTYLVRTEPTEEHQAQSLRSDIPEQLVVRDVTVDGARATVDVVGLEAVESTKQRLAVAQMVFTLTALEGIDEVVILLDGQPKPLPTDRGTSAPGEALDPAQHFPDLLGKLSATAASTTTVVVQPTSTIAP